MNTDEEDSFLWVGTISLTYKRNFLFLGVGLLVLPCLFLFGVFWSFSYYKEMPPLDLFWGLFFLGLFVFFSWFVGGILFATIRGYPKYYLTNHQLINKDWTPWRVIKTEVLDLAKIQTVYFVDEPLPDSGSVHFYTRPLEILLEEVARMRKPRLQKNLITWTSLGKCDLTFEKVNSPLKLIEALESILPLKPYPSLRYVYQRSGS